IVSCNARCCSGTVVCGDCCSSHSRTALITYGSGDRSFSVWNGSWIGRCILWSGLRSERKHQIQNQYAQAHHQTRNYQKKFPPQGPTLVLAKLKRRNKSQEPKNYAGIVPSR